MQGLGIWSHTSSIIGPAVSGLVAAAAFHWFTQKRERERWLLDNRKQECRELLSALSDAYLALVNSKPLDKMSTEELEQLRAIQTNSVRLIRDRIFIADDIMLNETSNRWLRAMERCEARIDVQHLHKEYEAIRTMVVNAARKGVASFKKRGR